MRNFIVFLTVMLFLGCADNTPQKPTQQELQTKETKTQETNRNQKKEIKSNLILSKAIFSTYHTILPCSNCEGIKTILTLNKDKTYTKSMLEISKSANTYEEKGTFDTEGKFLVLKSENGKTCYFEPNKESILQLNDNKQKFAGVLSRIYSFEPIDKEYKNGFYGEFFKFKNEKSFQSIVISTYKNEAKINVYSSLKANEHTCSLSGELNYNKGVFYFKNNDVRLSLHRINDDIFILNHTPNAKICKSGYIAGKYKNKQDTKQKFGKFFISELTEDMNHADIVRIFGTKNIHKDTNTKNNSHIIYNEKKEPLFKYTLLNGIITQIDVLSSQFKTPEGINLNSNFEQIKSSLKIEKFAVSKNQISLKIPSRDMVIKLKKPQNLKKFIKLEEIPNDTKIDQILLIWNQ
ncbi:copper resistance protein NlpE N-terminal domain-containing protein [Campylobacter sp. RM13119]|uniref:copper resistance protein NlpE n=1 Tax=Campylobacter californiensis TaxID=1032243 RepID=UPI001475408F|nr:copper resistance protein NlpE [Campylobacter sp. RM13119]MBE3605801.1 copper resistance protein NlpE N-terminal domain-containing protein [Campylobacter sp. RM13119]